MKTETRALHFLCQGCSLVGILTVPERPLPRGVLIIPGGPQYRVGSHRQFILLARLLGARGIPVLRFDYRGMGDSEGTARNFESVEDDLRSAINEFFAQVPALREVALWGLCDAATAAALYAGGDQRVRGLVLLNPWVRTREGAARATLRHYYLSRLGERGFWHKLTQGGMDIGATVSSLCEQITLASKEHSGTLPRRVASNLRAFKGPMLVILSGDDLTAREFADVIERAKVPHRRLDIGAANHTFARSDWREQVANATANWVTSW